MADRITGRICRECGEQIQGVDPGVLERAIGEHDRWHAQDPDAQVYRVTVRPPYGQSNVARADIHPRPADARRVRNLINAELLRLGYGPIEGSLGKPDNRGWLIAVGRPDLEDS